MEPIPIYNDVDNKPEWHDIYTLTLSECIADGIIDFSKPEYDFNSFDDEQRNRIYDLITAKYYNFELGIVPVKLWRIELVNTLNLTMLDVMPLYQKLKDGFNPFKSETEYGKSRQVFSDFPQTRLSSKNQDYASNANDREYEIDKEGNDLDRYVMLSERFRHPDKILVESVKTCFCGLVSVTLATY